LLTGKITILLSIYKCFLFYADSCLCSNDKWLISKEMVSDDKT